MFLIKKVKNTSISNLSPVLIQVSGGSCVGKSTFIEEIKRELGINIIVAQDNYQLGKNFADRKTSSYKYDDPQNFQINRCYNDMQVLINGNTIEIPQFDLVENIAQGTIKINSQKINLLEGVYSSHHNLATLSEFKIYIEAPYYLRFLRRIARFVNNNQNQDTTIPLRHMVTFVYLAHKDFVIKQKKGADLVLQSEEVLPRFLFPVSEEDLIFDTLLFQKGGIEIGICSANKILELVIKQDKQIVYKSEISLETKEFLSKINWLEM